MPSEKSVRYAVVFALGSLALGLAVSLFAVVRLQRRVADQRLHHREHIDSLMVSVAQRDTLARLNSMLEARYDSLPQMRRRLDSLTAYLDVIELRATYPGYYLIIDTRQNRFHLRRGDLLVRSGYCGTGKGWTDSDSGIVYNFGTPRGLRNVIRTGENPYWYRPDWYWIERGMRPPEPESLLVIPDTLSWEEQITFYHDSLTGPERLMVKKVPGALGDYKLDLGDGILLHYGVGRGRNSSHGCIRLSENDLEAIFETLEVGDPVVIY